MIDRSQSGEAVASSLIEQTFEFEPMSALRDHWLSLRDGARLPPRSALDPLAFVRSLSRAWIYRREEDGDFICELAGEDINAAWRSSIRGKRMSEIVGPDFSIVKSRWDMILNEPVIMYSERRDIGTGRLAERLAMPLLDTDGVARFVIGVSAYRLNRYDDDGALLVPVDGIKAWNAETLAELPEERFSALLG